MALREVGGQGYDRAQLGQECTYFPLLRPLTHSERRERRLNLILDPLHHVGAHISALEDLAALGVDHLAVAVHHVIVLDDVLADIEVVALNLGLGLLYGIREHTAH